MVWERSATRTSMAAAGLAALVVLSACGGDSAGRDSASDEREEDESSGSLTGQEISVWGAQLPFLDPLVPIVEDFERQTGATVEFEQLASETSYYNKLQLALASNSGPDIWFAPTPLIGQYRSLGASTLEPHLEDSAQTPLSWDYEDFPEGLRAQCSLEDETYCVPVSADTTILYYNKAHFAAAGIAEPPETMEELVEYAAKLTTSEHAGFCMRGQVDQSNYFTGQMMLLYYLPYSDGNKGVFLDSNWEPQLASPEALAMGDTFSTLMTESAPSGVSGYGFQECERDFNQGTVSMFWETSAFSSDVLDPQKSPNPEDVGFHVIPCPSSSDGHCTMGSPWGIYMNENSTERDAAWQLMQHLTSAEAQAQVVSTGQSGAAVRASVAETAFGEDPLLPEELGTALGYGFEHLHANPFPPLPNLLELLTPFGQSLSAVVSGQASVEDSFTEANDQAREVLERAGEL